MSECWNGLCIATDCDGIRHVDVTGYAWRQERGTQYDPAVGSYVRPLTPDDTASLFVGSGALDYPWYTDVQLTGIDFVDRCADDWSVTLSHIDPDTGQRMGTHTINHHVLLEAIRAIAAREAEGGSITHRCRDLLLNGPDADEVDFDAPAADVVIQITTLGHVLYG